MFSHFRPRVTFLGIRSFVSVASTLMHLLMCKCWTKGLNSKEWHVIWNGKYYVQADYRSIDKISPSFVFSICINFPAFFHVSVILLNIFPLSTCNDFNFTKNTSYGNLWNKCSRFICHCFLHFCLVRFPILPAAPLRWHSSLQLSRSIPWLCEGFFLLQDRCNTCCPNLSNKEWEIESGGGEAHISHSTGPLVELDIHSRDSLLEIHNFWICRLLGLKDSSHVSLASGTATHFKRFGLLPSYLHFVFPFLSWKLKREKRLFGSS